MSPIKEDVYVGMILLAQNIELINTSKCPKDDPEEIKTFTVDPLPGIMIMVETKDYAISTGAEYIILSRRGGSWHSELRERWGDKHKENFIHTELDKI